MIDTAQTFITTERSAFLLSDADLRAERGESADVIGRLRSGEFVVIERDFSREWYFVRSLLTDEAGWTEREHLDIPTEPPVLLETSAEFVEDYAAMMNFQSATEYFLAVDTARQRVYVLKKGDKWRLMKTFPCSTGKTSSPTVKGAFKLEQRGDWFYSNRLGSGAKWWIRFSGSYLFHSQAMNAARAVLRDDNEVGRRNSNGCVRLYEQDIFWIYKNIPDGTGVFVY